MVHAIKCYKVVFFLKKTYKIYNNISKYVIKCYEKHIKTIYLLPFSYVSETLL